MFQIYQCDVDGDILIAQVDSFNQACLAAWSRAKTLATQTYVLDPATQLEVEEYDFTPYVIEDTEYDAEDQYYPYDY